MTQLDDGTLVAYADGELDADAAREVESALEQDPRLDARVRILRETADLVRAALDEPVDDPLSPRLRKALDRFKSPPRAQRRWWIPQALAASLAMLVIGLGGGYVAGTYVADKSYEQDGSNHLVTEIAEYYRVYAEDDRRFIEIGSDRIEYIETWLGDRLDRTLRVPDLSRHGLAFDGARLMAVEGQPAGLLVYALPDGRQFGLCMTSAWSRQEEALTAGREAGINLVHWARSGYVYVLMGIADKDLLRTIAPDVARQLEAT